MGLIASALLGVVTLFAAVIPSISLPGPGTGEQPLFPAPPGYLLPWAGGQIQSVTQGEETSFTHNGLSAYAIDFGMNYDNVVASRSGRVSAVYDGSNRGGCDPALAAASNYLVIDHGDGTSALYLHLAYNSTVVAAGELVARGQVIALSGETGVTCSGSEDGGPGPHLHFQVQRTEDGRYFTQSLPVAFDDISTNGGVPFEGESLVSGNFGLGKPQKIKLNAYRAERVFAPKATPADPSLSEVLPTPTPTEAPAATETAAASDTPVTTETATETPLATDTDTPTPDDTETPTPEPPPDTPEPAPTAPPDSPTPAPSDTPSPAPSDTVVPAGETALPPDDETAVPTP